MILNMSLVLKINLTTSVGLRIIALTKWIELIDLVKLLGLAYKTIQVTGSRDHVIISD